MVGDCSYIIIGVKSKCQSTVNRKDISEFRDPSLSLFFPYNNMIQTLFKNYFTYSNVKKIRDERQSVKYRYRMYGYRPVTLRLNLFPDRQYDQPSRENSKLTC